MEIIRCKDQGWVTLEEHYSEIFEHGVDVSDRRNAKGMLHLLSRLQPIPYKQKIYALTSRYTHLMLLEEDNCEAPWQVIVASRGNSGFYIQYRMSKKDSPWPDAYIWGEARSVGEAIEKILIGMERSDGWKEN